MCRKKKNKCGSWINVLECHLEPCLTGVGLEPSGWLMGHGLIQKRLQLRMQRRHIAGSTLENEHLFKEALFFFLPPPKKKKKTGKGENRRRGRHMTCGKPNAHAALYMHHHACKLGCMRGPLAAHYFLAWPVFFFGSP